MFLISKFFFSFCKSCFMLLFCFRVIQATLDEMILFDIEVGTDARNNVTKAHLGRQLVKMEMNDRIKQMHAGVSIIYTEELN